jgi:hypothetical protein
MNMSAIIMQLITLICECFLASGDAEAGKDSVSTRPMTNNVGRRRLGVHSAHAEWLADPPSTTEYLRLKCMHGIRAQTTEPQGCFSSTFIRSYRSNWLFVIIHMSSQDRDPLRDIAALQAVAAVSRIQMIL